MRFKNYLIQEQKQYKIYVDMDGVLTDFEASFRKIEDPTFKGMNPWKVEDKYGTEAFWEHIAKGGLKFWSEMPWMKGGKKLWSYLKSKENVAILSAPARRLPNSPKGKKIWVKRELGNVPLILKRAREKQQYANEHSILIDDQQKNIKQWEQSGGIGIWHKTPQQTIKKLKAILEE